MSGIPGASLSGVEIGRIRSADPDAADEIERLGKLMIIGKETDTEFLRLCELLVQHGEIQKAGELLLANATPGDQYHSLYRHLFPSAEANYANAVTAFSCQFRITLTMIRCSRLLSCIYSFSSTPEEISSNQLAFENIAGDAEVHISYEPSGRIVADCYPVSDNSRPSNSLNRSLQYVFENDTWMIDQRSH
jgi:hypothetical protein